MSQKAKNLDILDKHGVSVPQGFVIKPEHYRYMIYPFANEIIESLPSSEKIKDLFLRHPIPHKTRAFLEENLDQMSRASRYVVRSSGKVKTRGAYLREDSENISLAGQFESYLNVPMDSVSDAIKLCWASLFNARTLSRFDVCAEYVHMSEMTVIVQEMVPAIASAVMMTVDPLGKGDVGGIDFTIGPCEAIVAGIASPDEVIFARESGKVLATHIGEKEFQVSYENFSLGKENIRRISNTSEQRSRLSVEPATIGHLINLGRYIEAIFKKPQDIEAVITHLNQIVITQTRPITCLPMSVKPFGSVFTNP